MWFHMVLNLLAETHQLHSHNLSTLSDGNCPRPNPDTVRIEIQILNTLPGFLPPAIRRMGEGNSFSLFTSRGGTPPQVQVGGTPSQVQVGGYPIPGPGRWGYPIPGPGPGRGGTPSQVWGDTLSQVWGGYSGYPPGIASTCYGYAAGGMPLAFTQEDFLVFVLFLGQHLKI